MNLTTAQIKDILENPEDISPKCLTIIITDMAERIEYIERCYMILDTKYAQLKQNYEQLEKLEKYHAKLHLNSMYGYMVTESLQKGEHKQ